MENFVRIPSGARKCLVYAALRASGLLQQPVSLLYVSYKYLHQNREPVSRLSALILPISYQMDNPRYQMRHHRNPCRPPSSESHASGSPSPGRKNTHFLSGSRSYPYQSCLFHPDITERPSHHPHQPLLPVFSGQTG